jgi:hypothetical protein
VNTQDVLSCATRHLQNLSGHVFDVLTVSKPISPEAALNLAKVISKLSPLLGNLIEFNTVEFLNDQEEYADFGEWLRQDPGFPDTIFEGRVKPTPGFEIKAWFPLATEITARFRDSQNHFAEDQTYVCMLAWLPERLIYGKPRILDVCVVSGLSIAQTRDAHYHNPPDYLVLEPEDTTSRTRNLQQTNTSGHKWQGSRKQFAEAQALVDSWGAEGRNYQPTPEYQRLLRQLTARYDYRLDTNFSKMDRIAHPEIEDFKTRVLSTEYSGIPIQEWARLFRLADEQNIERALEVHLDIIEVDAENILQ